MLTTFRIFHQVMTAMRVLHRDLCEKPKEEDPDFKPRQPNPNQWKILQGPGRDNNGRRMVGSCKEEPDRLEENFVSTMADARVAAMALQNLIHSWNEGWI